MRARDNPFRTERVLTVRYEFINGLEWDALLSRLNEFGNRAAIVGPEGSGKTTLQEDLASRLEAKGYHIRWLRLNRENKPDAAQLVKVSLANTAPVDLLFVDGAEQLGWFQWRYLVSRTRSMSGLVINTHSPGRLPTLIDCHTTPELLRQIVSRLVPPTAVPAQKALDSLFSKHHGNLRLCLRALYDSWASKA